MHIIDVILARFHLFSYVDCVIDVVFSKAWQIVSKSFKFSFFFPSFRLEYVYLVLLCSRINCTFDYGHEDLGIKLKVVEIK